MPAAATAAPVPPDPASTAQAVTGFMHGFSVEATRPKPADIEALKRVVAPGTDVYLSAIPTRAPEEVIDQAIAVQAAGLSPVPHVAARNIASARQLDALLGRFTAEAGVRKLLIIAGDREQAAGPYLGAIEVIESGLLQRHGIEDIGISGHPDGHPRLSVEALDRALAAKTDAAGQSGLNATIVTQFGFDPDAVVAWLNRIRDLGYEHPVRVGMAGPTSLTTLLRYAARCGVKASAIGASRQAGLVKHLFSVSAPDGMVRRIAEATARGGLGEVGAHFFSFGGVDATARWAAAAAGGRFSIDRQDGFTVAAG